MKKKDLSNTLFHLGEDREKYFNAVSPPVIQSSNFVFDTAADFRKAFQDEFHTHIYTRGNNPTVAILRKKLAALENAEDALVTSSGAAAISTAIITYLSANDHIICVDKPYSWTHKLIKDLLSKYGVEYDFVDGRDISNIEQAIQSNTKVIYLESPNSLTFELQDLKACSEVARKHGIVTMIDNSCCSPIFQNPIDFGIDIVIHSATKYINGHSDVVVGAICSSSEHIKKMFTTFMTLGTNISPADANLVIRGLRTLPLRIRQSNKTAMRVASFLEGHPGVKKVIYPGLPSFEQYELAQKQMSGSGALITIELNTKSKAVVNAFIDRIRCFLMAVSWGGHESLMIPSILFHDNPGMEDSPIPWTYVRLYIGLESADFLIKDLTQALIVVSENAPYSKNSP